MSPIDIFRQAGLFTLLTLVLDLVPLVGAIAYVLRPSEHQLALMRPLSLAGLFSGLAGGVVGIANGLRAMSRNAELTQSAAYGGLSEALVSTGLAFSCLTAAWLLVAVGMARTRD